MDEFTDDIYYSVLANAPYLLEQGQSLEQLEESIQNDYQLDYSIDRDLSDSKSIVFKSKKDNEVVHSIRGTATMEDLITDASLMEKLLTHLPTYPGLYTTLGAIGFTPTSKEVGVSAMETPRWFESQYKVLSLVDAYENMDIVEALKYASEEYLENYWVIDFEKANELAKMYNTLGKKNNMPDLIEFGKAIKTGSLSEARKYASEDLLKKTWETLTDYKSNQEIARGLWTNFEGMAESLESHMGFSQMIPRLFPEHKDIKKVGKRIGTFALGSYLAGKAVGGIQKYRFPDGVKNPRIIEEQAKFDKIKSKYPDANFVFTGHSLGGSVSNYLSRQHGHKAITFNPAPQLELADQFHKDSKIYKTRADFASLVSIFDKEQRRLVPQKVLRPHNLDNFIPPKIPKRTLKEPKVERQKAFVDSNKVAEIKDFDSPPKKCLENPELPQCKSYYYI
jgi:hypothetical protein